MQLNTLLYQFTLTILKFAMLVVTYQKTKKVSTLILEGLINGTRQMK